jgi:hypothetical protein
MREKEQALALKTSKMRDWISKVEKDWNSQLPKARLAFIPHLFTWSRLVDTFPMSIPPYNNELGVAPH